MPEKLFENVPPVRVVGIQARFAPIDLSVKNSEISNIENAGEFEKYIEGFLKIKNADVAFGGYNEHRNLYKRSGIFNSGESDERNIHIGLDLWAKAGTSVLAPLEATVHGFDYNVGLGNYGPTIILKHTINRTTFYSLYGHLSVESIEDIEIGDHFDAGDEIGTLGEASVNGDYAPHLHFQIIMDIGDHFGDYPGVCSENDLEYYLKNCPDPNLLLKLNIT